MNDLMLLGDPLPSISHEPKDPTMPIRHVRAMRGGVGPGKGAKHSAPTKPRLDRVPITSIVLL